MKFSKPPVPVIIALSISVVMLAACTTRVGPIAQTQAHSPAPSAEEKLKSHQEDVNRLSQNIKSIQEQISFANKQLIKKRQFMPALNAQSDSALRIAQQLRQQSLHATGGAKHVLAAKAEKAQRLADEKAKELLALNQSMDAIVQRTRDLQSKIKDFTAQKHTAQRLANLEAQHIKNLQATTQTQVARAAAGTDKKASLQTSTASSSTNINVSQKPGPGRRIASRHHHRNIHI